MLRISEQLYDRCFFNDFAGIHNNYVIRHFRYNTKIMGNQHNGGFEFLLNPPH
ncbi:hypothetical protein D3C85_1914490 [compost metagenome]